jgi:hypothetical protein
MTYYIEDNHFNKTHFWDFIEKINKKLPYDQKISSVFSTSPTYSEVSKYLLKILDDYVDIKELMILSLKYNKYMLES